MYVLVFFALAMVNDWLTCRWLRARESGARWQATALSGLLEASTWVPLWGAIQTEDYRIAIASVLGSCAGTAWALRSIVQPTTNVTHVESLQKSSMESQVQEGLETLT